MPRLVASVVNLRPARGARRGDDGIGIFANRRQQAVFGDLHAQFVMLIAEAARHATAAGIHLLHVRARDRPQQAQRIRRAPERLLMTMPVQ